MDTLIGLGIGALVATVIVGAIMTVRRNRLTLRMIESESRVHGLSDQLDRTRSELTQNRTQLGESETRRHAAEVESARLTEQIQSGERRLSEQQRLFDEARGQLTDVFKAIGAETLQANNQQFLELARTSFERLMTQARGDVEKRQQAIDGLVKPVRDLLERQNETLVQLEKKRVAETSGLEEQLKAMAVAHDRLGTETGRLVTALRRPEQRGRWGEVQLRNVVELAGMTKHCDFVEQPTTRDDQSVLRPDMIVRMPGEGVIVVDSKVALDAYLDGLDPDRASDELLKRHARQVADHVKTLASRRYWDQFERTPKIVVMFMPLESALVAALQVQPELHHEAMRQHVLIATPTLLVALLRAVAFGWQQEDVAANAREIARVGRDLYQRLARFVGAFEKIGGNIERAANAYNTAVGSLEARVLPAARSLKDLHATTDADVNAPRPLSGDVRPIASAELKPLNQGSGISHGTSGVDAGVRNGGAPAYHPERQVGPTTAADEARDRSSRTGK